MTEGLKFSPANTKLKKLYKKRFLSPFLRGNKKIYSIDLLAGHTCPMAKDCFAAVRVGQDGKRSVVDGKHTKFRCYAASLEALYTEVYKAHEHNTKLLKSKRSYNGMLDLIKESMPSNAGVIRVHSSGDYFNQSYFDAWVAMAIHNPDILFYGYTKNIPLWLVQRSDIPKNMVLTASRGGKRDDLIESEGLRESVVVYSKKQARELNLKIDEDDSCACNPNEQDKDFALLIHGMQPAGSEASKAVYQIMKRKGQR